MTSFVHYTRRDKSHHGAKKNRLPPEAPDAAAALVLSLSSAYLTILLTSETIFSTSLALSWPFLNVQYVDRPRFWNINAPENARWVRLNTRVSDWSDMGEMTASEARGLEGLIDVEESNGGLADLPPPAFGWYRERRTYIEVRFNGQQ